MIREDLAAACEKHQLTPKELIRAVLTRWNSLARAIMRGLELRAAIDTVVAMNANPNVRRLSTIHDLASLRLHPDGSRVPASISRFSSALSSDNGATEANKTRDAYGRAS